MQYRNDSKEPLILGGYHNGRYAEPVITVWPDECAEISDERIKLYDAAVTGALVPASKPKAVAAPALSTPAPKVPDEAEAERERLLNILREN
jgi:hypothetical protein